MLEAISPNGSTVNKKDSKAGLRLETGFPIGLMLWPILERGLLSGIDMRSVLDMSRCGGCQMPKPLQTQAAINIKDNSLAD